MKKSNKKPIKDETKIIGDFSKELLKLCIKYKACISSGDLCIRVNDNDVYLKIEYAHGLWPILEQNLALQIIKVNEQIEQVYSIAGTRKK